METDKAIRFIVVILIKYHQHELLYKEVEESMGPNELDCPMRIMNQLEGHPPTEGYSARWRERILQHHHQDMKPRKAILSDNGELRKEYPKPPGTGRLVLTNSPRWRKLFAGKSSMDMGTADYRSMEGTDPGNSLPRPGRWRPSETS